MIKKESTKQQEVELVSIEDLVPTDHILRRVHNNIDFSFVRDRMESLYSKNSGRPAIDPVVLFKMLFIGYMFGIRSERQLVKEIEVNVAYRWFLGLNLTDKVPHHSTISQNRRRRFDGTDVFRQMFEDVVLMGYQKNYIDGKALYTDSTHLKANANRKKFTRELVSENTRYYLEELDKAVEEDRKRHGKAPLPPSPDTMEAPQKEIKVSKTDPESGYMNRQGKPHGFYYLDHRTTDGKCNLITDVYITPANISDSLVYMDRLDYQIKRFAFKVEAVGLDAGYHTSAICHGLMERDIFGVISYRKLGGVKGFLRKRYFEYDREHNCYLCPEGHKLKYSTTGRTGFREYVSDPNVCKVCPRLLECTKSKNHQKKVARHVWEEGYELCKANRKTERGEYIRKRRSETIERSFADAKQLHSYRYARFRGRKRVETQGLMTAIVQNIKKMVYLAEKGADNDGRGKCGKYGVCSSIFSLLKLSLSVLSRKYPVNYVYQS